MANISIIFYGKPQSFESYEFSKAGFEKSNIGVPALKPEPKDGAVLHHYVQNNYHYLELYEFATAYDTGRSGVVIGVCIKSDAALAVSPKNLSILSDFLAFFKKKALTDNLQFNTYELLDIVEIFDVKEATYETIELNNNPPEKYVDGLKLFFWENFKNNIVRISRYISDCSDIYIAQNDSIFRTLMNECVWRDAGKQILTINGYGELIAIGKGDTPSRGSRGGGTLGRDTGGGSSWKDREAERDAERRGQKKKTLQNLVKFVILPAIVRGKE